MRSVLLLFALLIRGCLLLAQNVYTINADSVKLTGCDSSELIIENHTQNIPGFLFNTGRGRTIFKRGAQKIDSNHYMVGTDTITVTSNAWVQGGNSFGTTGILGTLDNNPLDFYVAGQLAARLTTNGHLLIGTTANGAQLLQVNGDAMVNGLTVGTGNFSDVSNTAMGYNVMVNNVGGVNNTMIGYLAGTGISTGSFNAALGTFALHADQSGIGNTALGYGAGFASLGSGGLYLGTNAGGGDTSSNKLYLANNNVTSLMYGDFSTGQIQINEDHDVGFIASAKFIVNGDSYLSDSVALGTVAAGTSSDDVLVLDNTTHTIHKVAQSSIGSAFNGMLNSSLAVNGPITAQKLHLTAHDWPDYVFDSLYHLLPLPDLEQYIQHNHHLPGLASAAETKKDGIEIGGTQATLLKKIEELTLYTIEQAKELRLLRAELAEIKNMITSNK